MWLIRFGPLFRNACSCLRLCQNIVCVVYPARYVPSFPYPHWTYRTRSASTWRVSSHNLGVKISWSVAINVCPCSFSMPNCRKASAYWMLPTKPARALDSTPHAQPSSLRKIGTVFVFDPSSPAARISSCSQSHWSSTGTHSADADHRWCMRPTSSAASATSSSSSKNWVSQCGCFSTTWQNVSDMVHCSSSTRPLRQPFTS